MFVLSCDRVSVTEFRYGVALLLISTLMSVDVKTPVCEMAAVLVPTMVATDVIVTELVLEVVAMSGSTVLSTDVTAFELDVVSVVAIVVACVVLSSTLGQHSNSLSSSTKLATEHDQQTTV